MAVDADCREKSNYQDDNFHSIFNVYLQQIQGTTQKLTVVFLLCFQYNRRKKPGRGCLIE
jgi:hypothetical protein